MANRKSITWRRGRGVLPSLLLLLLTSCGGAGGPELPKVGGNSITSGTCASSATAKVFLENPRTENPAIAFSASLSALGQSVFLTDLDGTCRLSNATLNVTIDREFPTVIANQTQGFSFTPADPRFQQVTTYYHANRVKNLVQAAGGDLSSLTGVSIDAHCSGYMSGGVDIARDNAFYLPNSKQICLGYTFSGSKKIYASDDADVIAHEFGHGVNHTLASTAILNSSIESGAIDESGGDYWANTSNNDPELSEWFLGVIDANDTTNPDPFYQRVATASYMYPSSMIGEIHFDSRPLTQALWSIRTNLGATVTNKLVVRMFDLLPATTRIKDAVAALQSAAVSLNLSQADRNTIDARLSAYGLLRNDSAATVSISDNAGRKNIYIIDDHTYSFQVGGNCNGILDVGETAMVVLNLESSGSALGLLVGNTTANSAGVTFPAGGQVSEFLRLNGGGADFVDVLREPNVLSDDATAYAAILVTATSSGQKDFTMQLTPMNGAPVNIPFSLTVQTNATRANNCANGSISARSLWPDP